MMMWLSFIAVFVAATCVSADCDLRYYQHYEHKGCKPVLDENGCPVKFQCETHSDDLHKKCFHDGKWYNERETIQQECDHCRCSGNAMVGSFIECAEVDCPDWDTQDKSCYMGYKPGDCCPREMCPQDNKEKSKTCTYNGNEYKIGQFVQKEDPCQSCICTENGPLCQEVKCLTGIYAQKIRKGCLPLYSEAACCLTGLYCENVKGSKPVAAPENTDGLCHYKEQYYALGSTVYPTSDECFECTCSVPPDFTCLRKKC